MAGGTFRLTGNLVNSGANTATSNSGSLSNAAAVDADGKFITCAGGLGTSYVVRPDSSAKNWVLTGSQGGTYTLPTLPAGFQVITAQLNYGGAGASVTNFYGGSDSFVNANATASVEFNTGNTITLKRVSLAVSPLSPFVLNNFNGILASSLDGNGYGFRFSCSGAGVSFELDLLTITGTYTIQSFSWTVSPTSNVKNGDPVTITGTGTNAILANVSSIQINYGSNIAIITKAQFDLQLTNKLVFFLPNLGNFAGTVYIYLVGDGFVWTGPIIAGTLTPIVTAGMGIYQIIPGQIFDTVYNPGLNTTVNIQIPNIYAKTGFIGG